MLKKKKVKYLREILNHLGETSWTLSFNKILQKLHINIYDLLIYYFIKNMFKFVKFMKIRTVDTFLFKNKFNDTLRYFFFLKKKSFFCLFTKNISFVEVCFYYIFIKLIYLRVKIKEIAFFKKFFIKKKREIFFFYNFFFFFNTEKLLNLLIFLNLRKFVYNYNKNSILIKKNVVKYYFFNFFFRNIHFDINKISLFKNFYYLNKNLKLKLNKSFLVFKIYIYNFFKYLQFFFKVSNKRFLKKFLKKKRKKKKIQYSLFFKSTLNNIFVYVYDLHLKRTFALTYIFYKKYFYLSLGKIGYFGPSKNGESAVYDLGRAFYTYCVSNKIKTLNLVLMNKPTKKYKEFIKGFLFDKYKLAFKINYIYIMPKFAHNGCRRKKRRRV
jgi:ribosomal protein S11